MSMLLFVVTPSSCTPSLHAHFAHTHTRAHLGAFLCGFSIPEWTELQKNEHVCHTHTHTHTLTLSVSHLFLRHTHHLKTHLIHPISCDNLRVHFAAVTRWTLMADCNRNVTYVCTRWQSAKSPVSTAGPSDQAGNARSSVRPCRADRDKPWSWSRLSPPPPHPRCLRCSG